MRFAGQLQVPDDTDPGLRVVVDVTSDRLGITAGNLELGSWPLDEVELTFVDQDRFSLVVSEDATVFVPDDPIRFSYDGLPLLDRSRAETGALGKLWTWLSDVQEAEDSQEPFETPRPTLTLVRQQHQPDAVSINLAAEQPPPPGSHRCAGRRKDGMRCRSPIVGASGFCAAHDPDRPPARRRRRPRRLRRLHERLDRLIEGVETGEVDPQAALAISSLVQAMCAVAELDMGRIPQERSTEDSIGARTGV